MFVTAQTLNNALSSLYGTAGHLLKIWFTLKHMGLSPDSDPIFIDTSNSTQSLKRLFSCGDPDERLYVPFAHTPRYLVMKHDASRSIIQTTVQRWASSGSVVSCDPTEYLDFINIEGSKIKVSPGRRYPFGLGIAKSGFALDDDKRVSIPITSFAVWYGRQQEIPEDENPSKYLITLMLDELNISSIERELVFVNDDLKVEIQDKSLSDGKIYNLCKPFIDNEKPQIFEVKTENFSHYARRVKSMTSGIDLPEWMRVSPTDELGQLLESGCTALLLYGPPRTGKTRAIDSIIARDDGNRCTIQIHDGWGYDHLVEGLKPDDSGGWSWKDGPLKEAILQGKQFVVLEEINRTAITQALGEVFSLMEEKYRGENNAIVLRSGEKFWIPENICFIMTMNTIDKSTEDVDDALIGRVTSIDFPPRPEDLNDMLNENKVEDEVKNNVLLLFAEILEIYPLGHGYFAGLNDEYGSDNIIRYYRTRIRPVLNNFLGELRALELNKIDNIVDDMFGK